VTRTAGGISIDGGEGVGRVTKNGLDQPVGNAAINSVPRKMIKNAVAEIMDRFEYFGGLDVEISVPGGERLAEKTFNPNLGIEGGISILGTSGIVEPMSEKALLDTIYLELKMRRFDGNEYVVITPGNYGERFLKSELDISNAVKCSNFIGDAIDFAEELGFSTLLLVGHIGKLVKLGSGIMNTHSRYADGRMETLALCAYLAGCENAAELLGCVTTDEAFEKIRDTKTIDILMNRIDYYLRRRTKMEIGAVMFSDKFGILGKTSCADEILRKIKGQ
ncbi:MAG: cobalt-precorrin-5B (C(1))-methyltransferase CbiD, partial [Oscillospiraceae bacterium]|nr:cobalt-precorrin-5B (C(1))-methyltransferase CbiD [Oscillospiraceae bacterium]